MGQLINSGKFQKFDYGEEQNLLVYFDKNPPEIPIENIEIPIAMYIAEQDNIADLKDNKNVKSKLKNVVDFRTYEDEDHLSMAFSKNMTYF